MPILTRIGALLLAALWAVLARIFAQPVIEKIIAKLLFAAAHWLAQRTSNSMDDDIVQLLEDQYYGRSTDVPD